MGKGTRRPLWAYVFGAVAAASLSLTGCYDNEGGGGGGNATLHVVYKGQPMQTRGRTMITSKDALNMVGKTAEGRDVFMLNGGGGGGPAPAPPIFVEVGHNQFKVLVPEALAPGN